MESHTNLVVQRYYVLISILIPSHCFRTTIYKYFFKQHSIIQMKRSQNNIGETEHRSIKVHYGPGGASNFSLAWGDQPQPATNTQKTNQKNESNFVIGEAPKQAPKVEQVVQNQQQTSNPQDGPNKTSVKVHAPPGGKSSITFG